MKRVIFILLLIPALSLNTQAQSDSISLSKKIVQLDTMLSRLKIVFYGADEKTEILKRYNSLRGTLESIKQKSTDSTKYEDNIVKVVSLSNSIDSLRASIVTSIGYKIQKVNSTVRVDTTTVKTELSPELIVEHIDIFGLGILFASLLFVSIWLIIKIMSQNPLKNPQVVFNMDEIKSFGIEVKNVEEFLIKIVDIIKSKSTDGELLLKILKGESIPKYENNKTEIQQEEITIPPILDIAEDSNPPISETHREPLNNREAVIYLSNSDTNGFFSEDTILDRPDSYTYYQIIMAGESDSNPKIHFIASKNDRALKNIIDNRTNHIIPVCEASNGYDNTKHNSIKELKAGTVTKENNGWRIKDKIQIEYV